MPYTRKKHGGKKKYKKGGLKFFNKTKSNPFKRQNSNGRFSPQFVNPLEEGKITGAYNKAIKNAEIAAQRTKNQLKIFNKKKPMVPRLPKRIPGVKSRGTTRVLTSPRRVLKAPARLATLPAPPTGGKRRKRTRRKRRRRRRRTRKRR